MSTKASQASALQAQALEAKAAEGDFMAESEADEASSIELKEESMALLRQSEIDAAKAVSLEADGAELSEASMTEQSESAEEFAQAAAADVIFKEELASGAEMSELSVESSAEATADEGAIALCQMIPFLDVVCDFVGGVAATALELSAAGEASEAAASFAAAAVAKEEEESHVSLATELETEAIAQMAEANELKQEGVVMEEKAQAEQAEAEELGAASKEEEAKSLAEKESAGEEGALAAEDEAEAQRLFESSVSHGVRAIWSLLQQTVSSILIMGFLLIRVTLGFLVPSIVATSTSAFAVTTYRSAFMINLLVGTGFILLSFSIWFATALTYDAVLNIPNIMDRGGTILKISLTSSAIQLLLLYAPTYWISNDQESNRFQSAFILVVDLLLTFAWNIFLCFPLSDFIEATSTDALFIVAPLVFVGIAGLHYIQFVKCRSTKIDPSNDVLLPAHSVDKNVANENSHLIKKRESRPNPVPRHSNRGWIQTHHTLLFEVLLTSAVASLLWSCLVRAQILEPCWPIAQEKFKTFLIDHEEPIHALICASVLLIMASIMIRRSLAQP